ncbi:MAG: hypothetical protein RJA70_2016 [Pseudomonadota bacterium]|jgi:S-adenosylmethionine:tRNA ribosyltransferase-isomerase
MLTSELEYPLPDDRIAQRPTEARDGARLLIVDGALAHHAWVSQFAELVPEGALVVLNDSRVMRARVFARRATGAHVELLFLRREECEGDQVWEALAKSNRPLRPGTELFVDREQGTMRLTVLEGGISGSRRLRADGDVLELLDAEGHVPLPPYIRRADEVTDRERYQTVFARNPGSAAAPTAGLHLTERMLNRLNERGIDVGYVTLHVGAGTFRPVSADSLEEHEMHEELYSVSDELVQQVERARLRGAPVVAVGTTVVRCLESAAGVDATVRAGTRTTRLMITPGYTFRVVGALLTNFHAPRSTLLALVFAFAGTQRIQRAYRVALESGYRFLSYGDAMWLPRLQAGDDERSPG